MTIVAEFDTALSQLRQALRASPGTTVHHAECHVTRAHRVKWLHWARGEDRGAFAAALDADETVLEANVVAEGDGRRLYSTTLASPPEEFVPALFAEFDVQTLRVVHSKEGTVVRVRCPSREAYVSLREAVTTLTDRFATRRLYSEESAETATFGVTPPQREALLYGLEQGYYAVPRHTTLGELAEGLGISDQAVSSRLRRGTSTLLWDTLARDGPG